MRPGNWFTRPINFVRDAIALDRARRIRARLSRDFYANLPVVFGAHRTHAAFDRTKRYRELMAVSDLDSQMSTLLPALRRFRLLFLPGFLADVILATDKKSLQKELRQHTHLAQYFDEQISWLSSFNKPPAIERLQLASEAVPEINAEHIERALRSDGRPVILFAHSKGGIDAVESLLDRQRGRVRRDLLDRVRLLIAVQSPFFGSPAAGYLLANRLLRSVSRYTLESLGGSQAALQSLTRRARCEYYNRNRHVLGRLTKSLPVLCFASENPPGPNANNTFLMLRSSRDSMYDMGIPNDGLVPIESAILPGSYYVRTSGVDHAVPVMPSAFLDFDRKRFTCAMLSIGLELIGRSRPRLPEPPALDCLTMPE